jgi:hypothetical protein
MTIFHYSKSLILYFDVLHDFYLQLMIILIGFQSSIAIATLAKNIHHHIHVPNSNLSYFNIFSSKKYFKK